VALAAAVLADEQALLARVDAVLARHPRLRRLLSGTRAGHEAHVGLLSDAAPDGGVSPSPTTAPTKVPGDARRAVRQLARLEDELSLADKRSAFDAQSGGFARVLASMAASAAQQSAMLSAAEVRRSSR
jgi:hypothetical protein